MARVGAEVLRGAPLSPGYRQRSERNGLACGSCGLHVFGPATRPDASAFRSRFTLRTGASRLLDRRLTPSAYLLLLFDTDRRALSRPPSATTLSRTREKGTGPLRPDVEITKCVVRPTDAAPSAPSAAFRPFCFAKSVCLERIEH